MKGNLKLLLCEDDENLDFLLRDYLRSKGYETDLYPDGESGYKGFAKEKYDLCICDDAEERRLDPSQRNPRG